MIIIINTSVNSVCCLMIKRFCVLGISFATLMYVCVEVTLVGIAPFRRIRLGKWWCFRCSWF